jgi:hypothetical protein
MAFDTNLAVRIATVLDNTGLKNADKGMKSLEKRAKSLGRTLGITLSTAAVVAYGRASVKAFMQDEAAATRLASAVKNLGLAFEQPAIDSYIQKLESSSAVADDSLRPALQSLLTTTRSLSESQKILGLALDVSRGTGRDLTQVTQDLAQAYVGNTRGLRKYNLGLTQAELKTMSFAEVQARLTKQFSGANAAFLDTYAGKLQVLTVAAGNAQETIGKGLVDALALAGGKDTDIQDVADAMQNLSIFTADVIRGLGVLAGKITDIFPEGGILREILDGLTRTSGLRILADLGADSRPRTRANRNVTGRSNVTLFDADAAKQKKLDADRAKLNAASAKAQKALTAEQKKQAALKKAGSIFDLEQIQLIAALKGQLSDEDRKRVELQFALLTNNTKEAQLLTYEIAKAQGLGEKLAKDLASLPSASNPFAAWDGYLDGLLAKARSVASLGMGGGGGGGGSSDTGVINIPTTNAAKVESPLRGLDTGAIAQLLQGGRRVTDRDTGDQFIIQIDGKAIASAVQNQSLSGNDPLSNRLLGGFK